MLQKKPKFENDWMDVKKEELGREHPQGLYMVDLGGGGPDLFYYDSAKGELSNFAKDRFLRTVQDEFIADMIQHRFEESMSFNKLIKFLKTEVTVHALKNDISPIICKIYQTGKARQQHHLGHVEPSTVNVYVTTSTSAAST